MFIHDTLTIAGSQTGSVELSSSLRLYDERDDRCTTPTTTTNTGERRTSTFVLPVSGNEDDGTPATSSSPTTTPTVTVSGNEDEKNLTTLSSPTTTQTVSYISNVSTASNIPFSTPTSQSTSPQ